LINSTENNITKPTLFVHLTLKNNAKTTKKNGKKKTYKIVLMAITNLPWTRYPHELA
jgi:hypothetical protein